MAATSRFLFAGTTLLLACSTSTCALTTPQKITSWKSSSFHSKHYIVPKLASIHLPTLPSSSRFRLAATFPNGEENGEGIVAATGNNNNNNNNDSKDKLQPQVYPQRWIQLGYLSILALLSDWICFSVAAAPDTFEASFGNGHSAASLIDMFLFMNVASCFLVTDIVAKVGLQRSIQVAAVLMMVGSWFRSGFAFLLPMAHAVGLDTTSLTAVAESTTLDPSGLVPYPCIVLGTLLVGAAQPFFQCTPPLLSAQWFASDERATSTAVALNFNQIGIATAFLVGGTMATDSTGLEQYFGLVTILSTIVAVGTLLQFQNLPPSPPSSSELEKLRRNEKEPPFLESVQTFFATPGFTRPLAAFVCSITITNVVGVSNVPRFQHCVIFHYGNFHFPRIFLSRFHHHSLLVLFFPLDCKITLSCLRSLIRSIIISDWFFFRRPLLMT